MTATTTASDLAKTRRRGGAAIATTSIVSETQGSPRLHGPRETIARQRSRAERIALAVRLLRRHRYRVLEPLRDVSSNLDGDRLTLDLETNRLTFGSRAIRLSPLEARLLRELINAGSRWSTRARLIRAVWNDGRDHRGAFYVHVSHLRNKLRCLTTIAEPLLSSPQAGLRIAAVIQTCLRKTNQR
jgi:DNA-binding response OmpR family regulator